MLGALLGHTLTGMWVGLATLLLAAGEREGTYRLNFLIIAVSTPSRRQDISGGRISPRVRPESAAAGAHGPRLGGRVHRGHDRRPGTRVLGGRYAVPAGRRHRDGSSTCQLVDRDRAVRRRRALLCRAVGGGDADQSPPSAADRHRVIAAGPGRSRRGQDVRPRRRWGPHHRGPTPRDRGLPSGGRSGCRAHRPALLVDAGVGTGRPGAHRRGSDPGVPGGRDRSRGGVGGRGSPRRAGRRGRGHGPALPREGSREERR